MKISFKSAASAILIPWVAFQTSWGFPPAGLPKGDWAAGPMVAARLGDQAIVSPLLSGLRTVLLSKAPHLNPKAVASRMAGRLFVLLIRARPAARPDGPWHRIWTLVADPSAYASAARARMLAQIQDDERSGRLKTFNKEKVDGLKESVTGRNTVVTDLLVLFDVHLLLEILNGVLIIVLPLAISTGHPLIVVIHTVVSTLARPAFSVWLLWRSPVPFKPVFSIAAAFPVLGLFVAPIWIRFIDRNADWYWLRVSSRSKVAHLMSSARRVRDAWVKIRKSVAVRLLALLAAFVSLAMASGPALPGGRMLRSAA